LKIYEKVKILFKNKAGVETKLLWVNYDGFEVNPVEIRDRETIPQDTYPGHVFRIRVVDSDVLLLTYVVPRTAPGDRVLVLPCDEMGGTMLGTERWPEFDALVHSPDMPCSGPSSNWSCVRYVSPEEVKKRDPSLYGYHADELGTTPYEVGQTVDHVFSWQDRYILNATPYEGGGYLKMNMTENLKKLIYPWYQERKMDSIQRHQDIPGGFTNNHKAFFDIIYLSAHAEKKLAIVKEMKQILEWWTKMRLRHSETFGVRIYRRDAMLVNHVDRQDTHVASAVIQVGQKVDPDGGWPLEVLHSLRPGRKEVYLQPGEMVLYEGARIHHGRPMRFRGKEFGNIFTHFAPISWYGLDQSRPNPHFDAEKAAQRPEL